MHKPPASGDNVRMSLRCFVEDLASTASPPPSAAGVLLDLSEQESRHAVGARRLSVGDELTLYDGRGHQAQAAIAAVMRRSVQVRVGEVEFRPRPLPTLTLAVAMPKGPRQDVLIEKCTELGVAALQPLSSERSVAGATEHKLEKWRRATIEAAKQSGQCWLPELRPLKPLDKTLADRAEDSLTVAAMLPRNGPAVTLPQVLAQIQAARSVTAFVGPEGGWSEAESDMLLTAGALALSLGPNVLRIETAAIALAAIVHATHEVGRASSESGSVRPARNS